MKKILWILIRVYNTFAEHFSIQSGLKQKVIEPPHMYPFL